jgi:hypothetical protein
LPIPFALRLIIAAIKKTGLSLCHRNIDTRAPQKYRDCRSAGQEN